MSDSITHSALVAALVKNGVDILSSLTPEKCHLDHMACGITTEAGELADAVAKQHVFYNKGLDDLIKKDGREVTVRENILEEMGDLEFYLEGLRTALGIQREDALTHNIIKLRKRYESKTGKLVYSDAAAHARADKESPEEPEFVINEPHWMAPNEDCMGNPVPGYWRVFSDNPTLIGAGETPEEAVADIKRKFSEFDHRSATDIEEAAEEKLLS